MKKSKNQDIAIKTEKLFSVVFIAIKRAYKFYKSSKWVKLGNFLSALSVTMVLFYGIIKKNNQSMMLTLAVMILWLPFIFPYVEDNTEKFSKVLISVAIFTISFLVIYMHWREWISGNWWLTDIIIIVMLTIASSSFSYFADTVFTVIHDKIQAKELSKWRTIAEFIIKLAAVFSALSAILGTGIFLFKRL